MARYTSFSYFILSSYKTIFVINRYTLNMYILNFKIQKVTTVRGGLTLVINK